MRHQVIQDTQPALSGLRSGIWSSGKGSIFTLSIDKKGCVSGFYQTAHGRPDPAERFAVTGFVNGNLIGMVVSWGAFSSLTTWCGRYTSNDGEEKLHLVWNYARAFADKENSVPVDEWATVITNAGDYYWEGALPESL